MGIVFRQSIKTTVVIFIGALLGAFIAWWYPYIVTQQQLGFINNMINIGALTQLIALLGAGTTMQIFIQKYAINDPRRGALISFSMLIPLVSILIFTVPYLALQPYILNKYQPQDREYFRAFYLYIPVMVFIWSYMTLFDLYLQSQLKVAIGAFMREVVLRIGNIILMVLFFIFKVLTFYQLVAGTLLMYAVPTAILFYISTRTKGFKLSINRKAFTKAEYKEIIHFSWFHLLLGITIPLMASISSLMLAANDKSGMASLAVYSRAMFVISVMIIPYRAMGNAAWPILNKAFINNNKEDLNSLFHRSSINILIVGVAMFLIIGCNLDNIVAVFPKNYSAIKPIAMILMIGSLIDMATGLNNELISISKYYKFSFRISVLLIIMLYFFNHLLIHKYSYYGAAWASTFALAIFNILKMTFLWKKLGIQPFTKKSFLVIIAGSIAGVIGYFLPAIHQPIIDAVVRAATIIACYGLLLLWLKASPDLNNLVTSVRITKKLF